MLDFNVWYGIGLALAITLVVVFVLPWLKEKGFEQKIFEQVKTGLLLFGYAFRDEKVKAMTTLLYGIVAEIEKLDIAPTEKKDLAVREAFNELLDKFNIVLDEDVIGLIIDIAVAYLPPTNKGVE